MFKQVRLNDAILKFYQRSQPIAFSNAETLYDDLVLLRDQILMYGDLSEAQTNYLNEFIEKFDTTLSTSVRGIFEKWLSDGFLVDLLRDIINEEVIEARDGEARLNIRLNRDKQDTDDKINVLQANHNQYTGELLQSNRREMERENANLISIDNSNHLKHPIDSYTTYHRIKDWIPGDPSTDRIFAPVIGKHNGILYVFWRSASDHVSNDGKIRLKKSLDNGLTWETTDRVVLSNTPHMYIYNANFITSAGGLFTLVFFYRDSQQKCHTAYVNSSDFGETWSDPLPLPKPNDVEETAVCGAHTIKNGVIFQTGYTLDHRVYIIKSSNQGVNWEFVGYVSQTVKMNEASITYVPKDDLFYLVARSGETKAGVTPYGDYENFMIVGESKDAITWSKFYEIPVYGHAPWTTLLSNDKLIVTYANRSRKYSDKLYSCDMVILQKGQPITNTYRFNRSENYDSYYSGVINDGTHTHLVYYQEKNALRYHRFISGQLNLFTRSESVPTAPINAYDNSSSSEGYWETNEKYKQSWQLEKIDLDLTSYTVKEFTIKHPLSVRGIFVGAILQSNETAKLEVLDNFTCHAKFKNATTIRVVIRNMTGVNLVVSNVDLRLFIVGE